jgi:hypothetical protein
MGRRSIHDVPSAKHVAPAVNLHSAAGTRYCGTAATEESRVGPCAAGHESTALSAGAGSVSSLGLACRASSACTELPATALVQAESPGYRVLSTFTSVSRNYPVDTSA